MLLFRYHNQKEAILKRQHANENGFNLLGTMPKIDSESLCTDSLLENDKILTFVGFFVIIK